MDAVNSVSKVLPKFGGIIGNIANFISSGVGKFVTLGNIFFILIIIFICIGLYKIWRMEMNTREYFRRRRREI